MGHWPYTVFHLACLLLSAIWPFPPLPAMGDLGPYFIWCSFPFSKPTAGSLPGYSKLCHWKLPSLRLTISPLSNCMSLPLNPSALGIQLPPQLHFDLVLHYFVVWSLLHQAQHFCALVMVWHKSNYYFGSQWENRARSWEECIYCLARLRTMRYFQASRKGSCYRGEWTTLAESSEAPGNSKYFILLAQIPLLNLRSHMLIRDLTVV